MKPQTLTKSILLLIVVVAISCADEPTLQREDASLVQVRNGILEFTDRLAYDKVSQQLNGMSNEDLNRWENSLSGFTSIRSVYHKAMEEEDAFLENGGNPEEHSSFVKQHIGAFSFASDDDIRPNLPPHTERRLSSVVNENGFIKIGHSIFEYRSGSIKEITDGDESKIPLLNNYSKSDMSQNIIVTKFTRINVKEVQIDMKMAFAGNSSCTGYTSGGGQRVKGAVELYASEKDFAGQTYYGAYVDVHATNQERRLGIWSGKRTSELYIVGDVQVGPDWGSFTVDFGTGGDLDTSIGYTHSFADRLAAFSSWPYITGSLTFYGRHGSNCSI